MGCISGRPIFREIQALLGSRLIYPIRPGQASPTGHLRLPFWEKTQDHPSSSGTNATEEKGKSREGKAMAAKRGGGQKGLLWRLPEVTSKELGKIGPAFGLGIGCGAGAGIGFFGGKTLFLLPLPLLRVSLVDWKVISILRCACSLRVKRLLVASGFPVRIMSGAGASQDGI
jgi:hypothetical protein